MKRITKITPLGKPIMKYTTYKLELDGVGEVTMKLRQPFVVKSEAVSAPCRSTDIGIDASDLCVGDEIELK